MSTEVTVVATIKAKQGMHEEIKKKLLALIPPTRSEKGCITYDLHHSLEDNTVFMFYEIWASKDDLDKHLTMSHLEEFIEKTEDMLSEPIDVRLWTVVE